MSESPFDRETRIRNAKLTMGQTFYLVTINRYIGNNPDAWPSQETLANAMNASDRAVRKWQKQLEKLGAIIVDVGDGRGNTNRYRLQLEALIQKSEVKAERRSGFSVASADKGGTVFRWKEEQRSDERGNRVPTERTKKVHIKEQAFVFPENLRTPEFAEAWQQWVQFRRESKKRLTQSTIAKQLTKLAEFGSQKAIRSIEQSIERGWQGLFDPESRKARGNMAASNEAADIWSDLVQWCIDAKVTDPAYPNKLRQRFGDTVARAVLTIKVSAIKNAADQKPPGRDFALKDLGDRFRQLRHQIQNEEAAHAT
jgi:hypothetical protein